MPDVTVFDQATTMIEKAWDRPIGDLEALTVQCPAQDPLLRSAMHIRSGLVVSSNAVAVHQDRLRAMTRPGRVPASYDLERITRSAVDLRVAEAESQARLQAISHIIDAHHIATAAGRTPATRLAEAAVVRSSHAPSAQAQSASRPAESATISPTAIAGPRR